MIGAAPDAYPVAVSAPNPHDRRDLGPRPGSDVANAGPPAGQPGHGSTAFLRNQPAHIVDGGIQGGRNDLFELICPSCGDRPDLDYSEVPPRLQWLRGPRTLAGGLAAYHKHLGIPWSTRTQPGGSGPGQAKGTQAALLDDHYS